MSEAKESQEPTMEEILASIRRIISEDGEPEGEGAEAAPEEPALEQAQVLPIRLPVGPDGKPRRN